MAGYIGKSQGVTQVDGYNRAEADAEFVDVTGDTMTGALAVNGNLTVDTNTLFVDAANNRVGVGRSNPSETLDVQGNILILNTGNPTMTVKTSGAGNNPSYILAADTNSWDITGIFSDASDPIRFAYNSSEKMRLDSSGNLLVGTTTTAGSVSNFAELVSGKFISIQGTQVGANGTPTTVVTLPATSFATYMVSGGLAAGDTTNYHNVSIVCVQNTSTKIINLVTSGLFFITVSGLNVQMRQNSGLSQNMTYCITRIA